MKHKLIPVTTIIVLAAVAACAAYLLLPPATAPNPRAQTGGDTTATEDRAARAKRPATWAQLIERPGCPNLHKVSESLYRGAQPSAEGMKQLKKLGIRTIVNLRSFNSDRDEIGDLDLKYEHITMKAWHAEDKETVRFLKIVSDKSKTPVFVHCQHGADRTGTMCVIHRVAIQGWSKEDAVKEMKDGGYNFHGVWQNLLRYINKLDIDEIKRKAGIK